ncbi:polysaccharide deacetylase family protein [Microlunatus speluncae]|uniref:polysaccharide deacetylase family protein n=1 Tax=Microlunatus speluncae TaxID=2594267 RepID=UPI0012664E40|nr:polysaccharide deacetylase family protein [Microlunatus speluncae]
MRRSHRVIIIAAIGLVGLSLVLAGGYQLMNARTLQVAGRLVHRVETPDKLIALTFDDGPTSSDEAAAILDTLAARSVRATFFVTGREVDRDPEAASRIVAAGHELGNHTWSHPRMIFRPPAEIAEEIESTDRVIRAAGYRGEITFRPPYGKKLLALPLYLAAHDRTTIMWDVEADSDGGPDQSAAEIAGRTLAHSRPGSIILLHPWHGRSATQQAIGPIIDSLHRQGYRFVTVSELING